MLLIFTVCTKASESFAAFYTYSVEMIKSWLKKLYYNIKYWSKHLSIGRAAELDSRVIFDGYNVIGSKCHVASSGIGLGTYIAGNSVIKKAVIGKFCSIGSYVQTGLGRHPSSNYVSTHPAFFSTQQQAGFTFARQDSFEEHKYIDAERKYVVAIGNDVWIGNNVIIMDGIKIGDGAVVATGAVVTKDVPPYAIYAGVPARLVRHRFTPAQIEKLLEIKWWNWSMDKIKTHSNLFDDVETFLARAST